MIEFKITRVWLLCLVALLVFVTFSSANELTTDIDVSQLDQQLSSVSGWEVVTQFLEDESARIGSDELVELESDQSNTPTTHTTRSPKSAKPGKKVTKSPPKPAKKTKVVKKPVKARVTKKAPKAAKPTKAKSTPIGRAPKPAKKTKATKPSKAAVTQAANYAKTTAQVALKDANIATQDVSIAKDAVSTAAKAAAKAEKLAKRAANLAAQVDGTAPGAGSLKPQIPAKKQKKTKKTPSNGTGGAPVPAPAPIHPAPTHNGGTPAPSHSSAPSHPAPSPSSGGHSSSGAPSAGGSSGGESHASKPSSGGASPQAPSTSGHSSHPSSGGHSSGGGGDKPSGGGGDKKPHDPKKPEPPAPTPPTDAKAGGCAAAVSRAMEWVNAKLQYCQSPNGAVDGDSSCSHICRRTSNPHWDPYRSDCSGLVSWAYGLPPPGRVTGEFAPFQNDISRAIPASELQPGDPINSVPSEHIMIFQRWTNAAKTEAELLEEPGCSSSPPHARVTTSGISMLPGGKIKVHSNGMTFQPIRMHSCK